MRAIEAAIRWWVLAKLYTAADRLVTLAMENALRPVTEADKASEHYQDSAVALSCARAWDRIRVDLAVLLGDAS